MILVACISMIKNNQSKIYCDKEEPSSTAGRNIDLQIFFEGVYGQI